MVDTSTSPAIGFMQLVERRNAATLLPIIQQPIQPGTMVYSDEWRSYNRVGNIPGLDHLTVNYFLFFVDPVTGVHTQTIESYWNRVKTKLKTMKGVRRDMLPGYLDECVPAIIRWRPSSARSPGSIRCKTNLHKKIRLF